MNDQDTIWDLEEALDQMTAERDRYRDALRKIADQQSGIWGVIANRALSDKRLERSVGSTSDTSPTEGSSSGRVP